MPRYIVFEGPDTTGKSTIAKMYAKDHGGQYVHVPNGFTTQQHLLYSVMKHIHNEFDEKAFAMLMLASWIDICEKLDDKHELVVFDRSPISTSIYQDIQLDAIEDILSIIGGKAADIAYSMELVVLMADIDTIRKRLTKRSDNNTLDELVSERIVQGYQSIIDNYGVKSVDTSNTSVNAVYEAVLLELAE